MHPFKIIAHQDDKLTYDELNIYEKLNFWCEKQAKELILSVGSKTYPFLFILSSPYLINARTKRIISTKPQTNYQINII